MFAQGSSLSSSSQKSLAFHLSYMEVYKDDVFDLFVERASVRVIKYSYDLLRPLQGVQVGYYDERAWADYYSEIDLSSVSFCGGV